MTARFGRNQKRKLREELASARASENLAFQIASEARRELEDKRARTERWASRILAVLGPDSAFNEYANRRGVSPVMLNALRRGSPVRLEASELAALNPMSFEEVMPYQQSVRVVEAFSAWAAIHRDELMGRVIVEVADNKGRLNYAVDNDTLEAMHDQGVRSDMFQWIVREMGRAWERGPT